MKSASLSEIKKELAIRSPQEIKEFCLTLAKFKKENKELLTYLLYEKDDEASYIESVKEEIETQFEAINKKSSYFVNKSTRKILRITKKYIRYSKIKTTEADLLLHFCRILQEHNPRLKYDTVLYAIHNRQIELIQKAVATLHSDLQFDYESEIEELIENLK